MKKPSKFKLLKIYTLVYSYLVASWCRGNVSGYERIDLISTSSTIRVHFFLLFLNITCFWIYNNMTLKSFTMIFFFPETYKKNCWMVTEKLPAIRLRIVKLKVQWTMPEIQISVNISRTFFAHSEMFLSLIHIWRCRRYAVCRSRWSPYH